MNPVEITAHEVDGGVEVVVETHDQWSLQVGADAGLSGNRGTFGFQLQEALAGAEASAKSYKDALATLEYTFAAIESHEQGGILMRPQPLPPLPPAHH